MTVHSINEARPHATGLAVCLECRHEWEAAVPLPVDWFKCPACTLEKGRFKYHIKRGDEYWECACGNDLFYLTRGGAYCPMCGEQSSAWE